MSLYVIDCGIWISAFLYGGKPKAAVDRIVLSDQMGLAISRPALDEVIEKLRDFKFNRFRTGEEEAILELYLADAVWVERKSISDCTDSDDNIYLECALQPKHQPF